MTLIGDAFLALWHDIEPASRTDYMEWHTREHMPERLSIPGFLQGKRLVNHGLQRYGYGTIYTGTDLDVFRSDAYMERLNNPTEWSRRLQPAFRNFLRVSCERIASCGAGEGGAVTTVRLAFRDGADESDLRAGARLLADDLLSVTGVSCAHVGLARPDASNIKTRETELRPEMNEAGFDAVVVVEGSGLAELESVQADIEATIAASSCGIGDPATLAYNLGYYLTAEDVRAASRQ